MKSILLASALMISGAAFAQTNPQDAGQPGTTMGTMASPSTSTTTTTSTMPPASTTDTTATTPTTTMGTTGTTGSGTVAVQEGGNMTAPPADTGPYPRCSRTVTDHCQQSSARESDTKGGPPKHRRTRR